MKVTHVIASLASRTGGVATAVVELALGLKEQGVENTIFSTDMAETASARRRRSLAPHDLPPGSETLDLRLLPAHAPKRLAFSPGLRRSIRAELAKSDLVHVHGLWLYPTYVGAAEALRADVPYVVSPQAMLDPVLRARGRRRKAMIDAVWQRRLLERTACLHFTAENEARLAADITPATPRVVVPNPIDVTGFADGNGEAFRTRYLDGHEGPVVLNHGRIAWKKGLDILVTGFAKAVGRHADTLLVFAGPDDEGLTSSLRSLAESEGVSHAVRFVGMLHGAERANALAAADVWALPSRSDGWASAVTEALAAGLPVLLAPGVSSAGELERTGAVRVTEAEPTLVAQELSDLLDDPGARAQLGRRAVQVARRFHRAEVGATMLSVYQRIRAGLAPETPASGRVPNRCHEDIARR